MAATADEVHGVGTSWVLMRVARSLQRPRQHRSASGLLLTCIRNSPHQFRAVAIT